MTRPDRTRLLVETAFTWAKRSTCDRLHVGAVIHREGRILVQGYNGAPAGMAHCNHECDCADRGFFSTVSHDEECPADKPCTISVHAEANAIAYAARYGVGLEGSEIVITDQPCLNCAMLIINAGIRSVWYVRKYRVLDGIDLLSVAGIKISQHVDLESLKKVGLPS